MTTARERAIEKWSRGDDALAAWMMYPTAFLGVCAACGTEVNVGDNRYRCWYCADCPMQIKSDDFFAD